MSLDTHIRFLAPVDPRIVWEVMRDVIEAPADYQWDRYAANQDMTALFAPNPTWTAPGGQGAQTVATMSYGAEGSLLDDSDYRGIPRDQKPPKAYVDVYLVNGDRDRHDEFAYRIIKRLGVPAAVQRWCESKWTKVNPAKSTLADVQIALGMQPDGKLVTV